MPKDRDVSLMLYLGAQEIAYTQQILPVHVRSLSHHLKERVFF